MTLTATPQRALADAWARATSYLGITAQRRQHDTPRARGGRWAVWRRWHEHTRIVELGSSASSVWLAARRGPEAVCQLVVLKGVGRERARDRGARRRLLDEARLTARMSHPNVVRAHGLHHERGEPLLVLEYLPGPTLASLVACAADVEEFSLEMRITIVARLLRGLDYVHRLRDFDGQPLHVVHGNVSPENVLVTYDGEVKLIDFGSASVRVSRADHTPARRRLPYTPPEAFSGAPDLRGDIFCAGVMLWELIARRPLWGRLPVAAIVRRLASGDIPRLSDALPQVDAALARICTRALSPQPEARYRSAAEMRAELEHYLAERGSAVGDSSLATLVCTACREQRREVQRAVETSLSDLRASLPHASSSAASSGPRASSDIERSELVLPAAIVGAGLLVAAGLWLARSSEVDSVAEATPYAASVRAAPLAAPSAEPWRVPAPRAPDTSARLRAIDLDVRVQPSHAVLYIDGQRLSSNPLRATMMWDPHLHTLQSEAQGFEGFAVTFRLDADLKIDTSLRPRPMGCCPDPSLVE